METKTAVTAFAALAQETRLSVFRLLVQAGPEGIPAGRIGEELEVAPATLSFHLKELSHAGLVTSRQNGRFIYYAADFERMAGLMTLRRTAARVCRRNASLLLKPRLAAAACLPNRNVRPQGVAHETLSRTRRRR